MQSLDVLDAQTNNFLLLQGSSWRKKEKKFNKYTHNFLLLTTFIFFTFEFKKLKENTVHRKLFLKINLHLTCINPLVTRKDSFVRFCSKLEEMLIIVPNTTPLKDFFFNDKLKSFLIGYKCTRSEQVHLYLLQNLTLNLLYSRGFEPRTSPAVI